MTAPAEARAFALRSFDGTSLRGHAWGSGSRLPILIVNAVGAGTGAWKLSAPEMALDRTVITWDHRGLHGSGPPATDRIDARAQAEDAVAVLGAAGYDRAAVVAWSTGTPIALTLVHEYPGSFPCLVTVCGGFGHPLRRFARYLELSSLLPLGAAVGKYFAGVLEGPFRKFVARPEIAGVVRQSGLIGPTADVDALVEVLRDLAECDLKALLETYEAVTEDAVRDLLPEIDAPTLLIAGERDAFTPLRMIEEMHGELPDADLVIYERATHYLPIEFPSKLAADVDRFVALRP